MISGMFLFFLISYVLHWSVSSKITWSSEINEMQEISFYYSEKLETACVHRWENQLNCVVSHI